MEISEEQILNDLKNLVEKSKTGYVKALTSKKNWERYKPHRDYIIAKTPLLNDPFYNWGTKVFWVLNGLTEFPKCQREECQKELSHINVSVVKGYPKHCSITCTNKDQKHIDLVKKVCMERFHATCPMGCKEISNKAKQTRYRHNREGKYYSEESKQKGRTTRLLRHGDENYNNREKYIETCQERYHCDNVLQYKPIKKKQEDTMEKRHGKRHALQLQKFIDKSKETCLKNFNVDSFSKTEKFKTEIVNHLGKKYDYDSKTFDSGWELAFYIWLKDNGVPFRFHEDDMFIKFIGDDGQEHLYFPDFEINGQQYIEIKGDHFFRSKDTNSENLYNPFSKQDYDSGKKRCILENAIILTHKEIKPFIQYVSATYGKDFIGKHKRQKV